MSQDPNNRGRAAKTSRRSFVKGAGLAAGAIMSAGVSRRAMANVLGANDRIQIGFIGCGGRAGNHFDGLAAMKEKGEKIDLVAACDVYRPRLQARVDKNKVKPYRTYEELLGDKSVDAVVIATPDHHHGHQAIDAIKAGKDVYCEKPVTHWRQFEMTKSLAKEVAKSKQIFMLGSQYMSDGAWAPAKKLIEEGAIGRPIHAECPYYRLGDWGERGMPIDDPNAKPGPDLDWEAFLGDAPKRPFDVSRFFRWRMYMDYSGGPSTDLYPHFMTQVIYMLGVKMPKTVVASGGIYRFEGERDVPDSFSLVAEYPEKLTLVVTGTQGTSYSGPQRYGVGPAPVIRGWEGALTFRGSEIIHIANDDKTERKVPVEYSWDQGRFYAEWLSAIRSRQQPKSTAELAYRVQTVLHMAMMSWSQGKVARFDAENEKIVMA